MAKQVVANSGDYVRINGQHLNTKTLNLATLIEANNGQYTFVLNVPKYVTHTLRKLQYLSPEYISQFPDCELRCENHLLKITSNERAACESAANAYIKSVTEIRSKSKVTHFLCFPTLATELKENLIKFKKEIMENNLSKGLDESMFLKPEKLHITITVFSLLDKSEETYIQHVLEQCNDAIMKPFLKDKPQLTLNIKGIECMNLNYSNVHVLYGKLELKDDETGELQQLINKINQHFVDEGLAKEKKIDVKLHTTFINSKYRKPTHANLRSKYVKRIPFDAKQIMERFQDHHFGSVELKSLKICQLGSVDDDGFYKTTASVNLNSDQ